MQRHPFVSLCPEPGTGHPSFLYTYTCDYFSRNPNVQRMEWITTGLLGYEKGNKDITKNEPSHEGYGAK